MAKLKLFSTEATAIVDTYKPTTRAKKPKTTEEMSVDELHWEISREYTRLKELEVQDETGWEDFEEIKQKQINTDEQGWIIPD